MNYKQQEEKAVKIKYVLEEFRKYKNEIINLKELSNLTSISTSSLQRYLKEDMLRYVSKEEYQEIELWLQNAKKDGLSRGGTNSQINNSYTKDEIGRFNGNKR